MSLMRTISSAGRFLNSAVLLLLIPTLASAPLAWAQSRVQNQAQSQSQPASQQQPPRSRRSLPTSHLPTRAGLKATTAQSPCPARTSPTCRLPLPLLQRFKNPPELSNYSIRVDVPEVSVDVGVLLEKTGQFVPNLKPDNFRVYENGVEQKVIGFKRVEAPITALMVCEFAVDELLLHLRHAKRRLVLRAAIAAPGLRRAHDLRHAHADRARFHPGQKPASQRDQLAHHSRLQRVAISSTLSTKPRTASAASRAASTSSSLLRAATPSPKLPSTRSCRR